MIEAAGGVVWRSPEAHGREAHGPEAHGPEAHGPEVLVVHRPKYDDWTLPKGKLDPGEPAAAAALREVEEETGLRCHLGTELPSVQYLDHRGRPKQVRYWAMQIGDGSFAPNDEVDEVCWVLVDAAAGVLSYRHDDVVVAALRELDPSDR